MIRRLVTLVIVVCAVSFCAAQGDRKFSAFDAYQMPRGTWSILKTLTNAGEFSRARSMFRIVQGQYPWDLGLPGLGIELFFLSEEYSEIGRFLKLPEDFSAEFPEWATMLQPSGWSVDATCYVAHLNGFKTGRDHEELEGEVLKQALNRRESLPFGMVDEEGGIHVERQVLTLLLLRDAFGGSHRKLLFDRAAKLAPNDTFILELKAKRLIADGEEAQAVEMYKKALKAKASEARIKYLKKELAEAEKMAEWRKRVGPRTDKKDGG
jgi:hypothetical protein